jgi:hypothetical protein
VIVAGESRAAGTGKSKGMFDRIFDRIIIDRLQKRYHATKHCFSVNYMPNCDHGIAKLNTQCPMKMKSMYLGRVCPGVLTELKPRGETSSGVRSRNGFSTSQDEESPARISQDRLLSV